MRQIETLRALPSHILPVSTATDRTRNRAMLWALIAIVALGTAVRGRHYFAAPSFWYDEAYVLVNIFDRDFAELAGPLRCEQAAPPLFLWSLRLLYLVFGGSEWAMRAPAFAASVVSVLAMISLTRRVIPGTGRIWAIGFIAVSQPAIFHAVSVKPYAGDMLAAILVTWAGMAAIANRPTRRFDFALFALAIVAPWFSYPSIFALGGVSMAMAIRFQRIGVWRTGLFSAVWVASFLAVWLLIGRHQRSGYLTEYWQQFFLDQSSLIAAVQWIGERMLKIGNYGTTGMGWPLLLFAGVGFVRLARRDSGQLALLTGPFILMFAANAIGFYPLEDRLFFFSLPWLWLLAASGVDGFFALPHSRRRTLLIALAIIPLLPGVVRYVYWLKVVPVKVEFRDAFEYVQTREQPGDRWWVSHPEVFEVYFGTSKKQIEGIPDLPSGTRIWIIAANQRGENHEALMGANFRLRERERCQFKTVLVRCFEVRAP